MFRCAYVKANVKVKELTERRRVKFAARVVPYAFDGAHGVSVGGSVFHLTGRLPLLDEFFERLPVVSAPKLLGHALEKHFIVTLFARTDRRRRLLLR